MQINLDFSPHTYSIRSYQPGEIIVRTPVGTTTQVLDGVEVPANAPGIASLTRSFIIAPTRLLTDWAPQTVEQLIGDHLEILRDGKPDVVILGTGPKIRFPKPEILAVLQRHRIGVEIMDSGAACRTYNFLVADGRQVTAAIMVGKA